MLIKIIAALSLFYYAFLLDENIQNNKHRAKLKHVIHINGIRGKSSVTRLIDAGLRAGGYRVFCKTTGTLPMTINTANEEQLIKRRGRANIKEQIKIMKQAAAENADCLVIECMAVAPALQHIAQHKILHADVVAITNTRMDHLDEMGGTLEEIADSLSNTIPQNGNFFTCDSRNFSFFAEKCQRFSTTATLVEETDVDYGFDFNENIELALAICERIGVPRDIALGGMRTYKRDPFALAVYDIKTHNHSSALFINGFSINDPDSIEKVYEHLTNKGYFEQREKILLINNRGDRPYRMEQHIDLAVKLNFDKVWIIGAYTQFMQRKIEAKSPHKQFTKILHKADEVDLQSLNENTVVFAVGNIANWGGEIVERAKKAGEQIG